MTKKNFDKFDSIAASKEKMEKWGIEPEELGWKDGEEDTQVEELEDGGDNEEESLSWEEMKGNSEIADKFYSDTKPEDPTEEEMLENAGGKWKKEKSQAEKIGEAVAKHIDQPHQEEQTEELSESPETQEPSPESTSKDDNLPPKWQNKLAERGDSWISEEELSQKEEDSVLKNVKSKSEVSELSEGRKRIDTSSIRAIAELNSLNQQYPDKVNILKTDRENNEMTAIVDSDIKQLID